MLGFLGRGTSSPPGSPEGSSSDQVAQAARHYEGLLAEKDEEITDLNAKITALRDALEKDEMDEFEMAITEKNKVLEEQFAQIDKLRTENEIMARRLEALSGDSTKSVSSPEQSAGQDAIQLQVALEEERKLRICAEQTVKQVEAALEQERKLRMDAETMHAQELAQLQAALDEARNSLSQSPNPQSGISDTDPASAGPAQGISELQAALSQEHQLRSHAEALAKQAGQAAAELHAQLVAAQQEAAQLQDLAAQGEELPRAQQENEELRQRLADAIAQTTEAQRALVIQSGAEPDTLQQFRLVLDTPENMGAMFFPREMRRLGRGWTIGGARPNSWAQKNHLQEGDELHLINGQLLEVLPEEAVMGLLRTRPLHLDWVRRIPASVPTTQQATPVDNAKSTTSGEPENESMASPDTNSSAQQGADVQALLNQSHQEMETAVQTATMIGEENLARSREEVRNQQATVEAENSSLLQRLQQAETTTITFEDRVRLLVAPRKDQEVADATIANLTAEIERLRQEAANIAEKVGDTVDLGELESEDLSQLDGEALKQKLAEARTQLRDTKKTNAQIQIRI